MNVRKKHVYFAVNFNDATGEAAVKIGISKNVLRRLSQLERQFGPIDEFYVLVHDWTTSARTLENYLHLTLENYSLGQEWFECPDEFLQWVRNVSVEIDTLSHDVLGGGEYWFVIAPDWVRQVERLLIESGAHKHPATAPRNGS